MKRKSTVLDTFRFFGFAFVMLLFCFHFKAFLTPMLSFNSVPFDSSRLLTYEWIIPLLSLLVLIDERKMFSFAAGLPSWKGFALTLLFLVAFAGSVHLKKPPLQLLSVVALTYALSYAFWGQGIAKLLTFPLGLLAFAIPLSFYLTFIESLSPALASGMTFLGDVLELTGFETFKEWFELKEFTLEGSSYRGLQLLFGVAATTFTLAHFLLSSPFQRLVLYLCIFPVALLIDLIRSFFICLIAQLAGHAAAVHFHNDSSDYLSFFVAVLLIFLTANVIVTISTRYKKPSATAWLQSLEMKDAQEEKPKQSLAHSSLIVSLTIIAIALTFLFINQG